MTWLIGRRSQSPEDQFADEIVALAKSVASDQDWITQKWLPRAAAAGLKLAAVVVPTSMVAMTNVEDVARVSENGIDTRFFSTMEEAAQWLTALRPAA